MWERRGVASRGHAQWQGEDTVDHNGHPHSKNILSHRRSMYGGSRSLCISSEHAEPLFLLSSSLHFALLSLPSRSLHPLNSPSHTLTVISSPHVASLHPAYASKHQSRALISQFSRWPSLPPPPPPLPPPPR